MCFGAIMLNKIKRVVFGIDLDKSGAMFFRDNLPLLFKQNKFHVDFTNGCLGSNMFGKEKIVFYYN
jgi:tRNA(Arg) A34 adenosine deaminase TadA